MHWYWVSISHIFLSRHYHWVVNYQWSAVQLDPINASHRSFTDSPVLQMQHQNKYVFMNVQRKLLQNFKHYTHHAQVTTIMYLYIVTCPLERDLSQIFYFFKWLNRLLVTKLGASLWIMVLDQFPGHSWNLLTLLDNQTCDPPPAPPPSICTFFGKAENILSFYMYIIAFSSKSKNVLEPILLRYPLLCVDAKRHFHTNEQKTEAWVHIHWTQENVCHMVQRW